MLNMLENFDLKSMGANSAAHLHVLAEVMKRAAANRRTHVGDPDFVDVATKGYISKILAKEMAKDIRMDKASRVKYITPAAVKEYESRDTTHFSVMDTKGNAVANTYTIGYSFGSGFVAEGTGILFDNQLRNFYVSNGEKGLNAYAPGKRMLSTMTPTIVFDENNKPFIVTGTPGGSRIINAVLQLLVNVIDFDMTIADATNQPRIHQGWNSQRFHYEPGISPDTLALLKQKGHEIRIQKSMASTQSILYKDNIFYGAADPRRPHASAMGVITEPLRN
jgi:gamma-glutamyltranspeptidase/glutathione hydrolase